MKTKFDNFLFEYVMNNDTLRSIVKETTIAPLYHALNIDNALMALTENKLGGYGIQRFWEDGKRKKDDEAGYESGKWMRGLSLTRDVDYAATWNDVMFVFDQEKLKHKYKIIPYNWGYSIGGGYIQGANVKREREEFLITGYSDEFNPRTGKKFKQKDRQYQEVKKMKATPEGFVEPLDNYLIGFFLSEYHSTRENNEKELEQHKKYLGIY
jgi:hypothetical protein